CRRKVLLGYFGEEAAPCGNCDLCDSPPELFDGTLAVRKALSAALRTDESFGAGHLIDILMGKDTDKIRQRGHDSLPTYGVGKDLSRGQWQAVFRQMMGHDLMRPDAERHGALVMTDRARPILRGEQTIALRKDVVSKATERRPAVRELVPEEDAPLFSALKAKRTALAREAQVPPYMIFPDRTLIEMAERRPASLDDMMRVNGIGAKKLERYGAAFLEVLNGATEEVHPRRRKLAATGQG
ncbi:unnamed protein product, partial [Laminaria digitata]